MRFAITANDRYLGVFESFVRAGWQPMRLFTVPVKSPFGNQQMVIDYATRHGAGVQLSRINNQDMRELREQGCEALIVASYDWIIGDWTPFLKYAVNFHCSPLPDGRGAYPVVRAILENRDSWGITCHRLTPKIDGGEILAVEKFPLTPDECHERLDLKVQMAARRLAARVAGQFTELWDRATPQGEGSYWEKFSLIDRIVDFHKPVEQTLRHIRAFGTIESLANVNGTWLIVRRAVGWTESHKNTPGAVVHVHNNAIVVAAPDGYIGILDSSLAPPNVGVEIKEALAKARN